MGYAEYGDPEGKPVMSFHGNNGSRLDYISWDAMIKNHGIRLIALDRPGFGLSDLKQGFQLADYPSDITELADGLGLDKFAIAAFAMATHFALPVAIKIPERLTGFFMIAGAFPKPLYKMPNVILLKIGTWYLNGKLKDKKKFSTFFRKQLMKMDKAKPDIEIFSKPEYETFMQNALDSSYEGYHRSLTGFINDMKVLSQPWAFDFKDISPSLPAFIFQGEEDPYENLSTVRKIAETIPNCTAKYYPGEGTTSLVVNKIDEILDAMR